MQTDKNDLAGEAATHPSRIMAISPQAALHNDEIMFNVKDTTATAGAKTHVMLDEKKNKIPFKFDNDTEAVKVPYRYAIQFARIPEFQVTDPTGRVIRAIPVRHDTGGWKLNHDECIARLDELTNGALLTRAQNAGGTFNKNASKAELITFLTSMGGMRVVSEEEARREEEELRERDAAAKRLAAAVRPGTNGIAENEVEFEA